MKTKYLLIFLLSSYLVQSQSTFEGDVLLTTQTEVDGFGINNYTAITGKLTIDSNGGDITDLSSLSSLENIGNNQTTTGLQISNNPQLQNLQGLNNITSIFGTLFIEENNNLINIEGLDNLQSIGFDSFLFGGGITILNNESLLTLNGLSIINLQGNITISNNQNLISTNALISILGYQTDEIVIDNNSSLTLIEGINVPDVINYKIINNNSLIALPNSETLVKRDFEIINNNSLTSLQGLENFSYGILFPIAEIFIKDNINLISLNGLTNFLQVVNIVIENNDALTDIIALNAYTSGRLELKNNETLVDLGPLSGKISGDFVLINNPSITTVAPMTNFNQAATVHIEGNENLFNLTGFENLTISNILYIINTSLISANEIGAIDSIMCQIIIENNPLLNSFQFLDNVTIMTSLSGCGEFRINQNNNIQNLSGLDNILDFQAGATFTDNQLLEDFCAISTTVNNGGLNSLTVDGNFFNPTFSDFALGNCNNDTTDSDGDGIFDGGDNCVLISNTDQTDTDQDDLGDICDDDDDNDDIIDGQDNCVLVANTNQADNDLDGMGDACDEDDDNDGVNDEIDNCPFTFNPGQTDDNQDQVGDICQPDIDNDGVLNEDDQCPYTAEGEEVNNTGCSISQNSGINSLSNTIFTATAVGENNTTLIARHPETDINAFFFEPSTLNRLDENYIPIDTHIFPPYGPSNFSRANHLLELENGDFIAHGNTLRTANRDYFSLAKYTPGQYTPTIIKTVFNASITAMTKDDNLNYSINFMGSINGVYYDGSLDFAFSYDQSLPGNGVQSLIHAFNDDLNTSWTYTIGCAPGASSAVIPVNISSLANGNLLIQVRSSGQIVLNDVVYGSPGFENFYFQLNPQNQELVSPVFILDEGAGVMQEDPFSPGNYYVTQTNFPEPGEPIFRKILKLNDNFEILIERNTTKPSTLYGSFPERFFFTENEIIAPNDIQAFVNVNSLIEIFHFDKNLESKYQEGYISNSLGDVDFNVNHNYLKYSNNKLTNVQSYTDEDKEFSPPIPFDPIINNIELPRTDGGFNTYFYGEEKEYIESDKIFVTATGGDAVQAFNYVKNENGTLLETDSHTSYLIFPENYDFTTIDVFEEIGDSADLVPISYIQTPAGWTLPGAPVYEFDETTQEYFFKIICFKDGNNINSAERHSYLKVIMTNDQNLIIEIDADNDGVLSDVDIDDNNPFVCRDLDNDGCDDCSQTGADGSGGDVANDGPDNDGDGNCDSNDLDDDNDGVIDSIDIDPFNPFVCTDNDNDGCDDCSQTGFFNPSNDGLDTDADGDCNEGDPDDDNDGQSDLLEIACGSDPLDAASQCEITLIPDPNFEQILQNLGFDVDGIINGQVFTNDISDIGFLGIPNNNISDLTGIEDFDALSNIDVSGNNLMTLDFSNNPNLEIITASNNNLQTIDVSANAQLTELYVNGNTLSSIDVSQNNALFHLNTNGNLLNSIDLSQNMNLEILQIWSITSSSVDLSGNPNLKFFSARNSQLTNVDFTNNPLLENIQLLNSQIETLNISNNLVLTAIEIGGNQLSIIDVSSNVALTILLCEDNDLVTLDISQNPNLTWLSVADNALVSLDLRNGNNSNINPMNATGNPDLLCVFVDDAENIPANWEIDSTANYVDTLEACELLSFETQIETRFSIIPNPASTQINIINPNQIILENIELFSLTGQKILQTRDTTIDISALASGVYFVKISSKDQETIKKLVIK